MRVNVFYEDEKGIASELVAVFANYDAYAKCYGWLEQLAGHKRMHVVESVDEEGKIEDAYV